MVNAIGHAGGPAAAAQANRPSAPGKPTEAQQPGFDEQAVTVEISGGEGEQRGVIRNLLNGHYSSVAAVRLAINFQDELAAQRIQSSTAEAQVSGESFAKQAAVLVGGFVATYEGTEQAEAVASAAGDFTAALAELAAQELTPEDLEAAIRVELDGFAAALQELLATSEEPIAETTAETLIDGMAEPETTDSEPVATEPVDEPIVDTAVEPVDEPIVDTTVEPLAVEREEAEGQVAVETATEPTIDPIDALIAELEAALVDALAPSIESASSTLVDFGEPNGNGVAFAKFLAIYEGLNTASEPEAPESGELVDTEA